MSILTNLLNIDIIFSENCLLNILDIIFNQYYKINDKNDLDEFT